LGGLAKEEVERLSQFVQALNAEAISLGKSIEKGIEAQRSRIMDLE